MSSYGERKERVKQILLKEELKLARLSLPERFFLVVVGILLGNLMGFFIWHFLLTP